MCSATVPLTVQAAFELARKKLQANAIPTPDLDASLLLEAATGKTTLQRITHPDAEISKASWTLLAGFIDRRTNNEPLHRIIGSREFYGLQFSLDHSTLVPRPETEILVDTVSPFVKQCVQNEGACAILDLGTGSGAIALSLLSQEPKAIATATDISPEALSMACQNAQNLGLDDRLSPVQSNWFECVSGKYDLIVSNPPYIATNVIAKLDPEVRNYDPILALDGGGDGLEAYRNIAANCLSYLKSDGRIAVEIGYDQKQAVTALFSDAGLRLLEAANDLSGQNRVLFFALL